MANDELSSMSPEDRKRQSVLAKLHPAIAAVVEHMKKPGAAAPRAKFIRNGRAEVQVWLSDASPAVMERLRKLGFQVVAQPKTAKTIIGRLPLEKLAALAEIDVVRYIAPVQ